MIHHQKTQTFQSTCISSKKRKKNSERKLFFNLIATFLLKLIFWPNFLQIQYWLDRYVCVLYQKASKTFFYETTETLNFSACTQIRNFHHKFNFSAKTHILTNFFADSILVGPIYLRFVPKSDKIQSFTKPYRLSSLYLFELIGIFVWKPNFSQRQAIAKILSVLHSTYKGGTKNYI